MRATDDLKTVARGVVPLRERMDPMRLNLEEIGAVQGDRDQRRNLGFNGRVA